MRKEEDVFGSSSLADRCRGIEIGGPSKADRGHNSHTYLGRWSESSISVKEGKSLVAHTSSLLFELDQKSLKLFRDSPHMLLYFFVWKNCILIISASKD